MADSGTNEYVVLDETLLNTFQLVAHTSLASILVDEPRAAGGLGSGPTPHDLLGSALGACSVMTMRLYATRKGWPVERICVRVTHERTESGKAIFIKQIVLRGAQISDEQRQHILAIGSKCPVHKLLEQCAEIRSCAVVSLPLLESNVSDSHARAVDETCRAAGAIEVINS
jgi:putative redox protein